MKRLVSLVLSLLLFCFVGCAGESSDQITQSEAEAQKELDQILEMDDYGFDFGIRKEVSKYSKSFYIVDFDARIMINITYKVHHGSGEKYSLSLKREMIEEGGTQKYWQSGEYRYLYSPTDGLVVYFNDRKLPGYSGSPGVSSGIIELLDQWMENKSATSILEVLRPVKEE